MRLTITADQPFNIDRLVFTQQSTAAREVVAGNPNAATPNPVVDELRLDLASTVPGGEITVTTMTGAVVGRQQVRGRVETVSLSGLPAGTYAVRHVQAGKATVWRVVKR